MYKDSHRVAVFILALGRMPAYRGLFASINQVIQLQHAFSKIVSPQLARHCVIGRCSKQILIIYVDSSAIAAKLRHITPTLLEKLGSHHVVSIRIVVRRYCYKQTISVLTKQKPSLSQAATQSLDQLAKTMPASPLKFAIESLLTKSSK